MNHLIYLCRSPSLNSFKFPVNFKILVIYTLVNLKFKSHTFNEIYFFSYIKSFSLHSCHLLPVKSFIFQVFYFLAFKFLALFSKFISIYVSYNLTSAFKFYIILFLNVVSFMSNLFSCKFTF